MRLGRPQTGSCSARWRNCRSPAAIAAAVRRMWRMTSTTSSAKPASATAMNGTTLADDRAAGQRRLPGEAGDGAALGVGQRGDVLVGGRRAGRRSRAGPSVCSPSADFRQQALVDEFDAEARSGAVALPRASSLSEPIGDRDRRWRAGRRKRWISSRAAARAGRDPGAGSRPAIDVVPGIAASRPRNRSMIGANSARRSLFAPGRRRREMAVFDAIVGIDDRDDVVIEIARAHLPMRRSTHSRIVIVADIRRRLASWR